MCVWGHAIAIDRHRLTIMQRKGRIPDMGSILQLIWGYQ